ncbi:MAG: hypothetical protein Fur0028_12130 [Bacteroidales bacterium]
MLFETERKAYNFISFNQEEIEMETGVAPKRSYFCQFCGGWHVTSIKEEIGVSKNEKLLENYLKEKSEKKEKIVSKNDKVNYDEKRNKIMLELQNQIKEMDNSQMEIFFSEKIDLLKKEIENLNSTNNNIEKEKLKELRLYLEIVYIVRKQNGFQKKTNKNYEKFNERELEEWKIWLEKRGYDKE